MLAETPAIPLSPKAPATSATTKKTIAQENMDCSSGAALRLVT
jgi:hypothetical protein